VPPVIAVTVIVPFETPLHEASVLAIVGRIAVTALIVTFTGIEVHPLKSITTTG
jgi:hypothetical protein